MNRFIRQKTPPWGAKTLFPKVAVWIFFGLILALFSAWRFQAAGPRIVIIGDSTVMTYRSSDYPMCGWGQELIHFFMENSVTIDNRAIGGRSSRSFIEEGRWASVLGTLQEGDFVLIQFGHNDRSTVPERHADTAQFRRYLTQYVNESRSKGAIPVLVSPMNMNAWNGSTLREVFNEGSNDYYTAMQRVVNALDVPFIDLEKKSKDLFQGLGQNYITKFLFMGLDRGEYPNYPNGKSDGTHFREMGAIAMAKLVVEGIEELREHEDVGILSPLLAPQYEMEVISNKPDAGLITHSWSYPAGAPMTLKTIPNSGETFEEWQSDGTEETSRETRHQFTMPDSGVKYYGIFRGGVTGVENPEVSARQPVTLRVENGLLNILSEEPILSIGVQNVKGITIYRRQVLILSNRLEIKHSDFKGGHVISIETKSGLFNVELQTIL